MKGTLLLPIYFPPMAPVILKRPSIENTTVLMPHPYAIDQVDALLDY